MAKEFKPGDTVYIKVPRTYSSETSFGERCKVIVTTETGRTVLRTSTELQQTVKSEALSHKPPRPRSKRMRVETLRKLCLLAACLANHETISAVQPKHKTLCPSLIEELKETLHFVHFSWLQHFLSALWPNLPEDEKFWLK